MNFLKFTLISTKDDQMVDTAEEVALLNVDHIVSIKPIKIMLNEDLIDGYWLRMSNGKKYRCSSVPDAIMKFLK
ncbi:MAG: hypothetical protein H6622_16300 [Halobacteriovoraceae bacterium]|nr:hypothetical protein [Halobacteriovoraceae bacterium]